MLELIKTVLFREDGGNVLYECRRCGTTVDTAETACPTCETVDIAMIQTR